MSRARIHEGGSLPNTCLQPTGPRPAFQSSVVLSFPASMTHPGGRFSHQHDPGGRGEFSRA